MLHIEAQMLMLRTLAGMTDEERDGLLLEIRDTLRDHGERLERIEKDHGSALRAHL